MVKREPKIRFKLIVFHFSFDFYGSMTNPFILRISSPHCLSFTEFNQTISPFLKFFLFA